MPILLPAQPPPIDFAGTASSSIPNKVAGLTKNAVAIRSIDPHDHDFADLQPLKQSIGFARIVLLGGTSGAATERAKQRLVRFLHEDMGFDVLASEASLFDAEEMDRALGQGAAPSRDLRQSMVLPFLLGGNPVSSTEFIDYVRTTYKAGRPLHLAGLATRISTFMQRQYAKRLFEFVDRIDPRLAPPADRQAITSMLAGSSQRFAGTAQWEKVAKPGMAAIGRVAENLGRLPANPATSRELSFYLRTLANLARASLARSGRASPSGPPNILDWLATVWRPDSKMVVWADNRSIARSAPPPGNTPAVAGYGSTAMLGAQEFGPVTYGIAFAEFRSGPGIPLPAFGPAMAPAVEDIEALFHAAGKPYFFLDFRSLPQDHWLRQSSGTQVPDASEAAIWPLTYDALVSIDLTPAKVR